MYTAEQMREFSGVGKNLKKIRNDVILKAKDDADTEPLMSSFQVNSFEYKDFLTLNHEKLLKMFLELKYFAEITVYEVVDKYGYLGEIKLDWSDEKLECKGIIKKHNDTILYCLEDNELKRVVYK